MRPRSSANLAQARFSLVVHTLFADEKGEELKSHGRGYQTRVNALLRHAMNSRWAARHEDEALRQKAQAAYDGLHAKRASGSIKRLHADKLSARMKDDSRASARVRLR